MPLLPVVSLLFFVICLSQFLLFLLVVFFFNDTPTTEIYTLSLHDALPIYYGKHQSFQATAGFRDYAPNAYSSSNGWSKHLSLSKHLAHNLTQAQTAGQYFTNDQIKEMTRKVSAEVDLVHQQTQNQRYGSSHIGATAKDISNVVTDAASGVVDIFHGIDKAVADTWNN